MTAAPRTPPSPSSARSPVGRRRRQVQACGAAAVGLVLLVLGACSESTTFDRATAVQQVLDQSQGAITREQAECYVNRVAEEVGANQLAPDARPSPSQIGRMTSIRIDCVGVANLGRSPATGTVRPSAPDETSARRVPQKPGDDPQLDLLYDACKQGNGQACDSLFDAAPPGSEYEEFAVTCGGRTREKRCVDVYGGAAVSTPAPTVPVPSVPPTRR